MTGCHASARAIHIVSANVGDDLALGLLSPSRFAAALRHATHALTRAVAPRRCRTLTRPRGRRPRTTRRRNTATARDPGDPEPPPPKPPRTRRSPGGGPGFGNAVTVRAAKQWSRRDEN